MFTKIVTNPDEITNEAILFITKPNIDYNMSLKVLRQVVLNAFNRYNSIGLIYGDRIIRTQEHEYIQYYMEHETPEHPVFIKPYSGLQITDSIPQIIQQLSKQKQYTFHIAEPLFIINK